MLRGKPFFCRSVRNDRFRRSHLERAGAGGKRGDMDVAPIPGLLSILATPAARTKGVGELLEERAAGQERRYEKGMLFSSALSCKVVDDKTGLVDYVASNEKLDAHGEIVRLAGWDLEEMEKNAPFIDSHKRESIADQLGSVRSATVDYASGELVERVEWAINVPENALARLGFNMTAGGFLKAVSVGFRPLKLVWRGLSSPADWEAAVALLKLDAKTASEVEIIHLEQSQRELSAVILGANGDALAKQFEDVKAAHKAGAVKDADLAAVLEQEQQKISVQRTRSKTGPALATLATGADAPRRGDGELLGLLKQYLNH